MTLADEDVSLMLKAFKYSADKHQCQRRKDASATPYINHPIAVAEMLWRIGGVRDTSVIIAAILHDTIEDTDATPQELEREFGPEVRGLVAEVTDDKGLLKEERLREHRRIHRPNFRRPFWLLRRREEGNQE